MIISGCGPVKIEGDVFLVKGDGKPQPSAAKEVVFIKAESFEDILIRSYLELVQEDKKRNAETITNLCNSASTIIISENVDIQDALNSRTANGKANNVTDQDGSCGLIQKQFDQASSASRSSRNKFDELIAQEEARISQAEADLINLRDRLEDKIANRENSLNQDLLDGIIISVVKTNASARYSSDKRGVLSVRNNSPYNIRLEESLSLQFYNSEGAPVGKNDDIWDCGDSYSKDNGVRLTKYDINNLNKSSDKYGFSRGGYLAKGQTIIQENTNNMFCKRTSYSPTETLSMTKKYGEDRNNWPDLSLPDLSKGYTFLRSNSAPRFIPLKDEVRTEDGNEIIYYNEPINFRVIAEAEPYEERDLINEQEKIIITVKNEIESITNQSTEDPLLANELDARSNLDQCSELTNKNELDQEQIAWMDLSLGQMQLCDLDDAGIFETLLNVGLSPADEKRLEAIFETNYSTQASYVALKRFADSEYKTTTNISGHYVMDGIPKGNYVVYSSYQDNFTKGIYLDNIEINEDNVIDLSNTKFLEVGDLSNVLETYYQDCSGVICDESDLRYTLDLNKAEKKYKKRKEAQEDLRESLRELERLLGN